MEYFHRPRSCFYSKSKEKKKNTPYSTNVLWEQSFLHCYQRTETCYPSSKTGKPGPNSWAFLVTLAYNVPSSPLGQTWIWINHNISLGSHGPDYRRWYCLPARWENISQGRPDPEGPGCRMTLWDSKPRKKVQNLLSSGEFSGLTGGQSMACNQESSFLDGRMGDWAGGTSSVAQRRGTPAEGSKRLYRDVRKHGLEKPCI